MKISRAIQFGLLAVVVFAAGAGIAIWQKKQAYERIALEQKQAAVAPATTPSPAASASSSAPSSASSQPEAPATAMPSPSQATPPSAVTQAVEPGKVIPNAPPMPESALAGSAAPSTAATPSSAPAVAGLEVAGSFSLTDQKGNAVTEKSWPGKYKLVFFGYTRCPDECPAALQKMSSIMDNYDPAGAKIQPLFITTDPAHDTREVMDTYMSGHPHILGLTGTPEQLETAGKGYKVYSSANAAGTVDHSAFIYLVSPDEKVLAVINPDSSAEEMIAKIKEKVESAAPVAAPPASAPAVTPAPAP